MRSTGQTVFLRPLAHYFSLSLSLSSAAAAAASASPPHTVARPAKALRLTEHSFSTTSSVRQLDSIIFPDDGLLPPTALILLFSQQGTTDFAFLSTTFFSSSRSGPPKSLQTAFAA